MVHTAQWVCMAESLTKSEFKTMKKEVEEYSSIKSVNRSHYCDIIIVEVSNSVIRPSNITNIVDMYGFELTHIDFDKRVLEYTITE